MLLIEIHRIKFCHPWTFHVVSVLPHPPVPARLRKNSIQVHKRHTSYLAGPGNVSKSCFRTDSFLEYVTYYNCTRWHLAILDCLVIQDGGRNGNQNVLKFYNMSNSAPIAFSQHSLLLNTKPIITLDILLGGLVLPFNITYSVNSIWWATWRPIWFKHENYNKNQHQ